MLLRSWILRKRHTVPTQNEFYTRSESQVVVDPLRHG